MIQLNFVHFIDKGLGKLTRLEYVLAKVLGGRAKLEHVGVESWHVWLDVVEKESLKEVRSVDSHWNFLEENGHGKAIVSDFILQKLCGHFCWVIQVEGADCALREPVTPEWAETIWTLGHIIHDHNGVSEISVSSNHGQEVLGGECHAELAADIKSN